MSLEDELEKLRQILSNPPFVEGPLERLGRFLLGLLRQLLGAASPQGDARWGTVAVGIIVAGVVLFFIVRAVRNTLTRDARLATQSSVAPITSSEALANAQTFAAAGDYRSAVRELYLATLILLDERGIIRFDRSLTNRETLSDVARANTALAADLGPVIDTFDRVWYGFAPVDATTFEQYRDQVERVRRAPIQSKSQP